MNDVGSREKAVFGGVAREPANAHHWHGEARLVSCLGWVWGCHLINDYISIFLTVSMIGTMDPIAAAIRSWFEKI